MSPADVDAIARPLKIASLPWRFTTVNARVEVPGPGTPGFQPRIAPASVSNRNSDAPALPPWLTTKPGPPLNTVPVGAPPTRTTSGIALPIPS